MLSRWRRISAREDGVTLVELMVVTSILLVIVGAMLTMFTVIERTSVRQDRRNQLTDEMRLAMERMTKEIRQATTVRSGSTASVLDIDTYDNGTAIHVVYTASGTTLTRTLSGTTRNVLTGLTSTAIFTYSPTTTTATDITIELHARPIRFTTDDAIVELQSQVRLRNRSIS